MPCPGSHRKHTEIVSRKQQRKFGAELGRKRKGQAGRMGSITIGDLESHLRESKGKKLPLRSKRRKRSTAARRALARAVGK